MSRSEIISTVIQSGGKIKRNELESKFGSTVVAQELSRGVLLFHSSDASGTKWIEVRVNGLKLCGRHCSNCNCDDANCPDLHVCKFHILSKCSFGSPKCKFGHDVASAHNRSIVERHGLADLSHSTLQSLFRNNRTEATRPLACKFYNTKEGCSKPTSGNKACTHLHVCGYFLQNECKFESKCERSHDLMNVAHTRRILDQYGIVGSTNDEILSSFQENGVRSLKSTSSSSHQDSGDRRQGNLELSQSDSAEQVSHSLASSSSAKPLQKTLAQSGMSRQPRICVFHLMESCRHGPKCKYRHSDLPYQWQWRNDKKWKDCDTTLNSQLEENFCKPETISATLPGQKTVDYEQLKLVSGGKTKGLRRLETSSAAMSGEARLFATKWLWYFKDNNDRWTQYGHQGTVGTRTTKDSTEIEERYQEYLQKKHDAILPFSTERFNYELNFKDFNQENLKTKVKRDIFRRPLFVTQAVLDDMKKAPRICTFNLAGNCAYGSDCRSHHSDLPYQWQWKKNEWQDCPSDLNRQLEENFCKRGSTSAALPGQQEADFKQLKLVSGGETTGLRRLETISIALAETRLFASKWLWYFEDSNGGWTEYGYQGPSGGKTPIGSSEMEVRYQKYLEGNNSTEQFQTDEFTYEVNFQTLYQENITTHKQRKIFRRPSSFVTQKEVQEMKKEKRLLPTDIKYPDEWTKASSTSNDFFFEVVKGSPEYEKVATLFAKTLPSANVSKIERVQNPELWEEYFRMKEKMKKRQDKEVCERLLFHGTGEDKFRAICQQGFDPRVAGLSTGTLHGCGSYFSSSARYSHDYTGRTGKLIVASVLVGDFVKGAPSYKRPPPRDPQRPYENLYDSVVDNCQDPTIFVIFDKCQMYPNYVIHYSDK